MKKLNTKATFSIGKTLSSGMHFACKANQDKPQCNWSHVEINRTNKKQLAIAV